MKTILSLLFILVFIPEIFAQNELTPTQKLASTAKVWGYLKYYHPKVAEGTYNWDEELFKVLPQVKTVTNIKELSQVYIDWIESLGEIKPSKKFDTEKDIQYFDKNFDLDWINNKQIFTIELSEKLKFIETNRHQGKKHYVSKRTGNVDITNEIDYKNFDWENEHFRLLTLFRYWNIVEYFFPYKYQTDTNWDEVLNKMIPKFLNPKNETDFHLAMLELVVSIDDSHGGFVTDNTSTFFGYYFIPQQIKLINDKVIITGVYNDSLAKIDDLKLGDVITKVNNQEVRTIFQEKEKYINGSNLPSKKANAYYAICNGSSDSVQIEFIRNDKTFSKKIKRYLFKDFKYKRKEKEVKYKIFEGNIGYINMGTMKTKDVPGIMKNLKDTKAIIYDIRNYPDFALYKIANYISSTRNDFYKVIYPDLNYPGRFIWRDGKQWGKNGELKYKGKVVLLVNEKSQSRAEFTTMGLQTGDNVTTIGSQTSGADGDVSRFEMVGGYRTMMSGIGIFYPDKIETQRKGVKIDIEVNRTIQGIIDGKDEILEKAIEYINK